MFEIYIPFIYREDSIHEELHKGEAMTGST